MAQIFPAWTNRLPLMVIAVLLIIASSVAGFFWYYGSPRYTDVGYRPKQPQPYSHKLHAGDLGIDCRYCHSDVEKSPNANIPPTQTCMNCHTLIKADSDKLLAVRSSWANKTPLEWVRVHELPDYAYFDHSVHLSAGVGCVSCHGNVAEMEEVTQMEPLSMSWCLDCHRNPEPNLRPADQITNMTWVPSEEDKIKAHQMMLTKKIDPPVDCSGCHR